MNLDPAKLFSPPVGLPLPPVPLPLLLLLLLLAPSSRPKLGGLAGGVLLAFLAGWWTCDLGEARLPCGAWDPRPLCRGEPPDGRPETWPGWLTRRTVWEDSGDILVGSGVMSVASMKFLI